MSLIAEADFGLSLLRESSFNQTTVLSPISIALALSLVHLGAKGYSKQQIKNAICKGGSHAVCSTYFSTLQKDTTQQEHFKLQKHADPVSMHIANRMFASNDIIIKPSYQEALHSKFDAIVQEIDYSNPTQAAEIVNDFVKTETRGKIDRLVKEDSFANGEGALLVNAVYFNGKWADPFEEWRTAKEKFFRKEREFAMVPFLKKFEVQLPFATTDEVMAVALPYSDNKYRLTIVLPKKRFGLAEALKNLTGTELSKLITTTNYSFINVILPKFEIRAAMELSDVLKNMGITDPFTGNADLSGITDAPICLGKVQHKAVIEVDEGGTVAAAATAIELVVFESEIEIEEPPINFVADHPFLFVLSKEGHVLFTGQYYG